MAETYANARAASVGTSPATVVTGASSGVSLVRHIILTNRTSSPITVTVSWTDDDDGGATTYLARDLVIAPGIPEVIPGPVTLEADDELVVVSSAASSLDVTASVLELT